MFVFCFLFLKNYENRQYGFETPVDLGKSQFLAQIIVIFGISTNFWFKKIGLGEECRLGYILVQSTP